MPSILQAPCSPEMGPWRHTNLQYDPHHSSGGSWRTRTRSSPSASARSQPAWAAWTLPYNKRWIISLKIIKKTLKGYYPIFILSAIFVFPVKHYKASPKQSVVVVMSVIPLGRWRQEDENSRHCLGPGLGFLRPCLKKNFRLSFSPNQLLPLLSLTSENIFLDKLHGTYTLNLNNSFKSSSDNSFLPKSFIVANVFLLSWVVQARGQGRWQATFHSGISY